MTKRNQKKNQCGNSREYDCCKQSVSINFLRDPWTISIAALMSAIRIMSSLSFVRICSCSRDELPISGSSILVGVFRQTEHGIPCRIGMKYLVHLLSCIMNKFFLGQSRWCRWNSLNVNWKSRVFDFLTWSSCKCQRNRKYAGLMKVT